MKKFITFFSILLFLVIGVTISSQAVDINPSEYYRVTEEETTTLFRDITYDHIIAETRTNRPSGWDQGYGGNKMIDINKWYGQQINVINVPRGNEARLVPWSIQSGFNWVMTSVTAMAEDFEAKNPGWVVLGGVNGDFYDWHNTKDFGQSGSGMEVAEGNVIRYRGSGWNAVGFLNDSSKDQLVYVTGNTVSRTATPVLAIYDKDDKIIKTITINKFNQDINDGETGAYFGRVIGGRDINQYGESTYVDREFQAPTLYSGDIYIVEKADRLIYQADDNSYYGLGTISATTKETGVTKTGFAIATKNPQLKELLGSGVKIRVQYDLTGNLSGIDNIIGCRSQLVNDGVLADYTTDSYDTDRVPRTLIGQKADGTVSLITIDGRQQYLKMYGTNQQEMNAFIKDYGLTECIMLDGGGSSTFFVREDNEFVVKNSPSDSSSSSSPRSVGNCVLVVVKEADFAVASTDIKDDTITFNLDTSEVDFSKITSIKCTLNGVTKEVKDNKVIFDGLTHNTAYQYVFSYDTKETSDLETMIAGTISSAKTIPTCTDLKIEIGTNKIIFTPTIEDPDGALEYYRIFLNGKRYPYLDEPIEVKCTLEGLEEIQYDILLCYDLNDGKGRIETSEPKVLDVTPEITEPEKPEEKEETKKGCKKNALSAVLSLISLSSLVVFLKKRKY